MDIFIPFGFTPYGGERNYGVYSTMEKAQEVLAEEKKLGYYESYDIYQTTLDERDYF